MRFFFLNFDSQALTLRSGVLGRRQSIRRPSYLMSTPNRGFLDNIADYFCTKKATRLAASGSWFTWFARHVLRTHR